MTIRYRPEIDGLRAVAVLSVILYHAGYPLKGGYLGVDVFFVISGYLITKIILAELEEHNTFSFIFFYERRARRILPALGFAVFLSIPAAWFSMDSHQLEAFGVMLLAVFGFVSNFVLSNNIGYFKSSSDIMPMLHTWSIAIEEQFYIIFPVLLLTIWRVAKRYLASVLTIFMIGSLLYANWSSQLYVSPDAAFFLLPARGWELITGAVLAAIVAHGKWKNDCTFCVLMPSIGISMIGYAEIFFDGRIQHPSFITTVPVFGTAILILYCKPGELISDLLASKILVGIGRISYSMYLIHFPILAFSKLSNLGKLPDWMNFLFLPIVLVSSFISWKWIESPFRDRKKIGRRQLVITMSVLWSLIVATGCLFQYFSGFPERLDFPVSLAQSLTLYHEDPGCLESDWLPEVETGWFCELSGENGHRIDFILAGDSHAVSAIPAFRKFGEQNGLRGIAATRSACPPLMGIDNLANTPSSVGDCSHLANKLFDFVRVQQISLVFLVGHWNHYIMPEGTKVAESGTDLILEHFPARLALVQRALKRTIDSYASIGVKVVLIGSIPIQSHPASEIYKKVYLLPKFNRREKLKSLHVSYNEHRDRQKANLALFQTQREKSFFFLDPTPYYCNGNTCLVGSLEQSFYTDTNHLSFIGSRSLGQMLADNAALILGGP